MNVYTTSEVRTYQRCREEHRIAYGMLVWPAQQSDAMRFGTLIHAALERWWRAHTIDYVIDVIKEDSSFDAYEKAKALAMIAGYDARWNRDMYETLAVERSFRFDRDGFIFSGKLDAVARDLVTGEVLIVEHKTSNEDISTGSGYWARLTIDDQVSNYFPGARSLGFEVDGCLYDVLAKPRIKPYEATPEASRRYRKDGELYASMRAEPESPEAYLERCVNEIAEHPDRYYRRGSVVRFEHEEQRARESLRVLVYDMERMDPAIPEPRNPQSCERYKSPCPYLPVCSGATDLNDTRYRRSTAKHEELGR